MGRQMKSSPILNTPCNAFDCGRQFQSSPIGRENFDVGNTTTFHCLMAMISLGIFYWCQVVGSSILTKKMNTAVTDSAQALRSVCTNELDLDSRGLSGIQFCQKGYFPFVFTSFILDYFLAYHFFRRYQLQLLSSIDICIYHLLKIVSVDSILCLPSSVDSSCICFLQEIPTAIFDIQKLALL